MEKHIVLPDNNTAQAVLGYQDKHLRQLQRGLRAELHARGTELTISGEENAVAEAENVLNHLLTLVNSGIDLSALDISYALNMRRETNIDMASLLTQTFFTTSSGRAIKPKSFGQWQLLQAIRNHTLVFAIGPAGTGKTFLAVMMAVAALRSKQVSRLVLARPAVEAGEKLGFLPGDMQEKVNPYLRPVYDALGQAMGVDASAKAIERGIIEVAPLAYMRGRTLDDAFIILDEAQNTSPQQMKMFLTRIGQGSRAVITGDITQIDLPNGSQSGLIDAERRLQDIDDLAFCYLNKLDVVRHPLVQKIIAAYEKKWI